MLMKELWSYYELLMKRGKAEEVPPALHAVVFPSKLAVTWLASKEGSLGCWGLKHMLNQE